MPHPSLSRRRFLYLGGAAAAAGALAAHTPLSTLAAHPAAQTVDLTFWTPGGSTRYCNTMNRIEQNYEKLHPNVKMSKVQCGTGQQDFLTVLLARIAAGNPPDATIYWGTPVSLGARGAVQPLDAFMATSTYAKARNWPASALASCQFGGKTWGLPVTAGTYAMWYNADWFRKKGIPTARDKFPKTWDDLRHLSKEFTHWKGGKLVSAGYLPFQIDVEATLFIWSALNGGQLYDADHRKYTIDSDANVAMMEYMVSWLNEEYKGDMAAVANSGNWTGYVDSKGRSPAFQNGALAMMDSGFWFMGDIYSAPLKFHDYQIASYPVGPHGHKTTSGYWPNWVIIPQGSHHPQEAFSWLDYLSGVGVKLWFSVTPDMPANKAVPANLLPAVTVAKRGRAYAQDVTRFFHHQLDVSIPMWNSPVQDFATDQLTKAVQNIMYKKAKPKDALAAAQGACQNQLAKVAH